MKKLIISGILLFGLTSSIFSQSIVSVDPDSALRGEIVLVTITGTNVNFNQATASARLTNGADIIQAEGTLVVSDTVMTAAFRIPSNATIGLWDVRAGHWLDAWWWQSWPPWWWQSWNQHAALLNGMFIGGPCVTTCPSLISATPDTLTQNERAIVSITGVNTYFTHGTFTTLTKNGKQIRPVAEIPLTDTTMDADFIIPGNADTGWYDLNVEQDTLYNAIYIKPCVTTCAAIIHVAPDIGMPGTTLDVHITGLNTHFLQATQATSTSLTKDGQRIFSQSVNPLSDTYLIANFSIPSNAMEGFWDVNVKLDTLHDGFYIGICKPGFCSTLQGNIYHDLDNDCVHDQQEVGLLHRMVNIEPGPFYAITDSTGNYSIDLDTGSYTITQVFENQYEFPSGCSSGSLNFQLNNFQDTTYVDFPTQMILCPKMTVDISASPWLRACRSANYYVNYCNEGTQPGDSAYVEIFLDTLLSFVGSSIPLQSQNGQLLTFGLGTVPPGACENFSIQVDVSCDGNGLTPCVEAHIYPDTICLPPDPQWDGSSVQLEQQCISPDTVSFRIMNVGQTNMTDSLRYYIVEDNVMLEMRKFALNIGQFLRIVRQANGATMRLEADQSAGHPGISQPAVVIEACGTDSIGSFTTGLVTSLPEDDGNPFISIDCDQVIRPYDPNDKNGFPTGVDDPKYITAEDEIEYKIRFQNTGTDTAVNVVIRDTLPPYLDITTLRLGVSSHPYEFRVDPYKVLVWTFNNIMLPDSNVNEPASHGFVKFKIDQVDGNPIGTVIENQAAIYFDYNAPVLTNTEFHTIGNRLDFLNWDPDSLLNLKLRLKACLGGPYDSSAGLMNDYLRSGGWLPMNEPYSSIFSHHAPGSGEYIDSSVLLTTGDRAVVDWIFIELRDKNDSTSVVATRSALILRNGNIVDMDGHSPVSFTNQDVGAYFVALRHRNHLGVMTLHTYDMDSSITAIDFTFADGYPTYGSKAQQDIGGKMALWCGDVTGDGIIKYSGSGNDRDPILVKIGGIVPTNVVVGYHPHDVNNDGVVKYSGANNDRDIILRNIGGQTPTSIVKEKLPE